MKAWELLSDDEKVRLINDKMDRIDENLDAHFESIERRKFA